LGKGTEKKKLLLKVYISKANRKIIILSMVDCGAIPKELAARNSSGYLKRSFTGATQ